MTPDILYADNHLLAVNKPAGLATQPSTHHVESVEGWAKAWVKAEYAKPGEVFLHAVHRLDLPVSGVVVLARTSKALSRLNAAVREGDSAKVYLALVEGRVPNTSGELRHWLRHDEFQAKVTAPGAKGAKEAVLRYRILRQIPRGTLVEVALVTGRYHQIRAQWAAIGCPVVGDAKYGARASLGRDAIGLHHWRLTLEHPVQHQPLTIEAPPPDYLRG
jgi:23S rRNA pseudouridine1911/1915/1917 synthase